MENEATINPTGFVFVKDGISLNFQADVANKKLLLLGSKTIALDLVEAKRLKGMISSLINIMEPTEPIESINAKGANIDLSKLNDF